MKIVILILLISSSVYAKERISFEGEIVSDIVVLMKKSGVEVQGSEVGDFLQVKSIKCNMFDCNIERYQGGDLIVGGIRANLLFHSFLQARVRERFGFVELKRLDCLDWIAGTDEMSVCRYE
jgi:hypothetical protein